MTEEEKRLEADKNRQAYWKRWGPYLSERQWGTVREDIALTVLLGTIFPTLNPITALIAGEKMAYWEFLIPTSDFVSRSPSGMAKTPC